MHALLTGLAPALAAIHKHLQGKKHVLGYAAVARRYWPRPGWFPFLSLLQCFGLASKHEYGLPEDRASKMPICMQALIIRCAICTKMPIANFACKPCPFFNSKHAVFRIKNKQR